MNRTQNQNTPRKKTPFVNVADLEERRKAVVASIGDIHQDSLTVVMDAFLPRISTSTLADIRKRFLKVPIVERLARPSTSTEHENEVFSVLCSVVNEIGDIAASLLNRPKQVEMVASPNRAPEGGPSTMPDAVMKLIGAVRSVRCFMGIDTSQRLGTFDSSISWADCAGACEWKKKNTLNKIIDVSSTLYTQESNLTSADMPIG
jgi:hypothetical protein